MTDENVSRFASDDEIAWCPGCGNFKILSTLKEAMAELGIEPHNLMMVSGIGQAAKLPHYIRANVFNGLHGRAVPPATGLAMANRNLKVVIASGDGDTYGEGGNHLIHGIRRNIDVTHFVHDNQIYGLTKGQGSPTTSEGQKASIQVDGVMVEMLRPLALAISLDCSFVARSFSGDPDHLKAVMKEAVSHRGYALVDILQPCVSFNKVNTNKWYKDHVYYLEEEYDPTDRMAAFAKSLEWEEGIPLGVLYRRDKPTYMDKREDLEGVNLVERQWTPQDASRFLDDFR